MLEAHSIRVLYGLHEPVSLTLNRGERVALLGPNGSGKSTLIKALTGRIPLDDGVIILNGESTQTLSRKTLARTLGVLHQRENIVEGFTVQQLVSLGRYAHLGPLGMLNSEDSMRIERSLTRMRLDALAHRHTQNLSGGEFQRARIARLLAQEAKLLILDEPTAHLDLGHAHDLAQVLVSLCEEKHLGLLAAVHDLNIAALYFNRVILLKEGRVIADGSVPDVMTKSTLESVFETTLHVVEHPDTGRPQFLAAPQNGHET